MNQDEEFGDTIKKMVSEINAGRLQDNTKIIQIPRDDSMAVNNKGNGATFIKEQNNYYRKGESIEKKKN